jgi:hypothetical protein
MNLRVRNHQSTLLVALVGTAIALLMDVAVAEDSKKYEATFTPDGELIRPSGWREWVFVGSQLTPNSPCGEKSR